MVGTVAFTVEVLLMTSGLLLPIALIRLRCRRIYDQAKVHSLSSTRTWTGSIPACAGEPVELVGSLDTKKDYTRACEGTD